jgi:hypothetical protein
MEVQKHSTIAFRGRALPCKLLDESDSGVRLAEFAVASCPDEFVLHIGDGTPRQCRTVWRNPAALGARYLEDERVRRLRHSIGHFEGLLLAGVSAEMARVYRAEVARAQEILAELRLAGASVPDLTAGERATLAELVREAIQRQRFSLSINLRQLRTILIKLEVPSELVAEPADDDPLGEAATKG